MEVELKIEQWAEISKALETFGEKFSEEIAEIKSWCSPCNSCEQDHDLILAEETCKKCKNKEYNSYSPNTLGSRKDRDKFVKFFSNKKIKE
jgi:hypothetical protein